MWSITQPLNYDLTLISIHTISDKLFKQTVFPIWRFAIYQNNFHLKTCHVLNNHQYFYKHYDAWRNIATELNNHNQLSLSTVSVSGFYRLQNVVRVAGRQSSALNQQQTDYLNQIFRFQDCGGWMVVPGKLKSLVVGYRIVCKRLFRLRIGRNISVCHWRQTARKQKGNLI